MLHASGTDDRLNAIMILARYAIASSIVSSVVSSVKRFISKVLS